MFSVGSEHEARQLLVLACETNMKGEFVARELAQERTIPQLMAFGERLSKTHDLAFLGKEICTCKDV